MSGHEGLWNSYTKTIVDVMPPGEPSLRVSPAPCNQVGVWPPSFTAPIFVITAWNPAFERLTESINRERQEALDADLSRLPVDTWPAVGLDPYSDYREGGVAVSGLSEPEAVDFGIRFGQNAIFAWTPTTWVVLSCVDSFRHESGWQVQSLPEHVSFPTQPQQVS